MFKTIIIFKINMKFKIDITKQTNCDTLEMLIFVVASNKIKIILRKRKIVLFLSPHIVGANWGLGHHCAHKHSICHHICTIQIQLYI